MTALANALELLALEETNYEKNWSLATANEFQDLFDLANDVYIATLETHVASLGISEQLQSA